MNFKPIPFQTYGSICGGQTAMQDGLNCISNQNNEINNNNLAHTGYHTSETMASQTTGSQNGGRKRRVYGKRRRGRGKGITRTRMYGGSNQTTCPQPPHILQGASAVNPLNTMCSGQQNLVNAKVQGMYDADVEYPFKSISQSGGRNIKRHTKSKRTKRTKRNHKRTHKQTKRTKRTHKRNHKRNHKRTHKRRTRKNRKM